MIRIDKILTELGYGSRKDIKKIINEIEIVSKGDKIVKPEQRVDENDLYIEGIKYEKYVYYLLNKPKGYLSATESDNYPLVIDLVPYRKGIFPVGRLDLDTEGLLLITNDGLLAHNLINPKKAVEKEYYFEYKGKLIAEAVSKVAKGININNEYITKPAILKLASNNSAYITLTEGKYHEVKRIVLALGAEVTYLKRVRLKNLNLGYLGVGEYRKLSKKELDDLKNVLWKNEKN